MSIITLTVCVVGAAFALYLLFGWLVSRHVESYRKDCSACKSKNSLELTQMYKATTLLNGKRAPDLLKHYKCEHCGTRFEESFTRGTLELIPSSKNESR